MDEISAALYGADMLVFASPVYYFGLSSQIKTVIDRFYASFSKPYPITSAALLLVYGGTSQEYTGVCVDHYHTLNRYMQWQDKGVITAGGLNRKNDILGNPALQQAEKLGKSIS